jgi:aldose sugar dehydrogenase
MYIIIRDVLVKVHILEVQSLCSSTFLIIILVVGFIVPSQYYYHYYSAYGSVSKAESKDGPIIKDSHLKVDLVFKGLKKPTTMAFLGPNDILVLEKDQGTVRRIVNGRILPEPLLDVNVANANERGMLGIAVSRNGPTGIIYVFLYFTESKTKDGTDECPTTAHCKPGHEPLGNRLYRYVLQDNKLVNPKLLLDLPATPGPAHNGGAIIISPDNNIYIPIGDVRASTNPQAEESFDGRGGILRITQDGKPVGKGILGNKYPLNLYYSYGMRNGFGIDFDPVTKKLWDTENADHYADEINLVYPGFNSGHGQIDGFSFLNNRFNPNNLLTFGGKGKYSDPEFVWANTVGPTAIKFLDSDKLGKQYENDMFVGDFHGGNIYHFKLNKSRTGLVLNDSVLADKIADTPQQTQDIIFGQGFGGITDMQVGPDGYLYVVSISNGAIYRIVPEK